MDGGSTLKDVKEYITYVTPTLERAREIIITLTADKISNELGPQGYKQYVLEAKTLSSDKFAAVDGKIVERLLKNRKGGNRDDGGRRDGLNKRQKKKKPFKADPKKPRVCYKCKKEVPEEITMAAHKASKECKE